MEFEAFEGCVTLLDGGEVFGVDVYGVDAVGDVGVDAVEAVASGYSRMATDAGFVVSSASANKSDSGASWATASLFMWAS